MSKESLRIMLSAAMLVSLLAFFVLGVGCSSSTSSASSSSSGGAESSASESSSDEAAQQSSASSKKAAKSSGQSIPDKNGFDEKTNKVVTVAGVDLQIPTYYEKSDSGLYFAGEDESSVVILQVTEVAGSEKEFNASKSEMVESYIDGLGEAADESTEPVIEDTTVAGCPAITGSWQFVLYGAPATAKAVFFYNTDAQACGAVVIIQAKGTKYDYFSDFDKILNTAVKSDAKASKASSKTKRAYEVTIDDVRTGSDYKGDPIVIVTFSWTNNSKESTAFAYKVYPKCFQNGVECDIAVSMDTDSSGYTAEVKPGYGTTFELAYSVKDDSDVTIEVGPLVSANKEVWIEQTFSLS